MTSSSARENWENRRYCLAIVRIVFYTADTLTVRLLLAWASGLYAILLIWPELANLVTHSLAWLIAHVALWSSAVEAPWVWQLVAHLEVDRPSIFERPSYAILRLFPGGVWLWFGLFMAHMLGVHWRVFDPVERPRWAQAINMLGFAVWAYSTTALVLALGLVLPTSALELIVIFFSFWVMVRTGLQDEIVTQ